MGKNLKIAVGSDHGGLELKNQLLSYLQSRGFFVQDCGTHSKDAVDYPRIAYTVARLVGSGSCDRGIVVDGAGIGSAMAANKVRGVRAAACYSVALAKNSREHNDANVLTLGSGQTNFETRSRSSRRSWRANVLKNGIKNVYNSSMRFRTGQLQWDHIRQRCWPESETLA